MRNNIKTFFSGKRFIAFLVLSVYFLVLMILTASSNYCAITKLFWFFLGIVSLFLAFLVIPCPGSAREQLLNRQFTNPPRQSSHRVIISMCVIFFTSLMFFLIAFLAMYSDEHLKEGTDIQVQYLQASGLDPYNNWHPVLHTLLFYTLPMKIFNNYRFLVILQIIYFCLAFTYLIFVLYESGAPKSFLAALCGYVWLNPYLASYIVVTWKDVAMMIFAIVLFGYYIRIICSKGEWLKNNRNLILFSLVTVICSYMRHNAILFVAPLVLIILFYSVRNHKIRIRAIAAIAVFSLSVQVIFIGLNVESPSLRTVETIGLPLSIWANVMQNNPSALPAETQAFMYDLVPQELYESYYASGGFNTIKSIMWPDLDQINALSYAEVLKYTFQCFRYAPKESLEGLAALTSLVWGIDNTSVFEANIDSSSALSKNAAIFTSQLRTLFSAGAAGILTGSTGFALLIMFIFSVCLFAQNRTSFIHLFPLFCYDFGTMLLLTGRSEYRLFLVNIPLWLPTIFLMLRDDTRFGHSPECMPETIQGNKSFHNKEIGEK